MTLKSKIFENPIVCEKTQYQYTISNSSENTIPYIVPIFSNIILGQYKYWFLGPNILAQYTIFFFEKNFNDKIGSKQVIFDHPFIFLQILFFLSQNTVNKIL